MKIRPVGAEFFQADGRTDMMKLVVAVRNISNTPKKTTNHNIPVYVEGIQSNFISLNPYALNPRL